MDGSQRGLRLEIRLLGDLQVLRGGHPQPLPASKKTRALLGYLVATGQAHLRERLCDLFWDGPNDPRAALRWSLTKIRPLLNDPAATRLIADRERVACVPGDAEVDAVQVRDLLRGGVAVASVPTLKTVIRLFRGEFLDGLQLPACYRYYEWCMAEREALSALRLAALSALVERLDDSPDEALLYARAWAAADPLSEAGHAAVVQALGQLRRNHEALQHYEYGRRLLESELAAPLSGELERAWQALRTAGSASSADSRSHAAEPLPVESRSGVSASLMGDHVSTEAVGDAGARGDALSSSIPLIGRIKERNQLARLAAAASSGESRQFVLISGVPGIGKSRLLAHLREQAIFGGRVLDARGFEAETVRPYGVWIDAIRALPHDQIPASVREDMSLLLPELGPRPAARADEGTRLRLFDGIVTLLRHLTTAGPLTVIFDDVQWLDEASASLLHYTARAFAAPSRLLVVCAARSGELEDNATTARVMQSLRREDRLREIHLQGLDATETAALARAVHATSDPETYAESGGNPLCILEMARVRHDDAVAFGGTLDSLIAGQLARLDTSARHLLDWAAALGRRFTLDLLVDVAAGNATGDATTSLLAALGELERRSILHPAGPGGYDFAHDLYRQATYRSISQPRRRLIHRQIARVVAAAAKSDDALAGDLAHHAGLAGDDALAARACATAGDRCLRLFAIRDATSLAERGLGHLQRVPPGTARLTLHIALLKILILASSGPGMRRLPEVADELSKAVSDAMAAGMYEEASTGYYLLSVLYQEAGDDVRCGEHDARCRDRASRQSGDLRQTAGEYDALSSGAGGRYVACPNLGSGGRNDCPGAGFRDRRALLGAGPAASLGRRFGSSRGAGRTRPSALPSGGGPVARIQMPVVAGQG